MPPSAFPPISPLLLGLVYLVWPLDLVPDLFGPLGRLDDILVLGFVVWRMYSMKKNTPNTSQQREEQQAPKADAGSTPLEVLGLRPDATRDEIETRYRELAMKYHPDRVAHLGKEFHSIAHEKMIEIQKAYQALTADA